MKRFISAAAVLVSAMFCANVAAAQEAGTGYEETDSLVYRPAALLDASLEGRNILDEVHVTQDAAVAAAYNSQIERNKDRKIAGYRVRIFFDNSQSARVGANGALARFSSRHPGVPAYMAYVNPYFKVTVGDFRTKSDALKMLMSLRQEYPTAFVVKENINYPVVDEKNSFIVDTIRVIRRVAPAEIKTTE